MPKFLQIPFVALAAFAVGLVSHAAAEEVIDDDSPVGWEEIVAEDSPVVRITTPVGSVIVELFADKPITTANFLRYIRTGRYIDSIAHRLDPGFVVQAGGFALYFNEVTSQYVIDFVSVLPPILNEFSVGETRSNVYGTLAMARVSGQVNSATSGWYINLGDNLHLDGVDEGFTVFGRVVEGLDTLEAFNNDFFDGENGGQGIYDANSVFAETLGPAFGEFPLLEGNLTINNLIFTDFEILRDGAFPPPPPDEDPPVDPPPDEEVTSDPSPPTAAPGTADPVAPPAPSIAPRVALRGPATIRTRRPSVVLRGRGDAALRRIEWRLGGGKFRAVRASQNWRLRLNGLKPGRNVVSIRGISESGQRGNLIRVRVIRQAR